jgi:Amt family ammonium transporter
MESSTSSTTYEYLNAKQEGFDGIEKFRHLLSNIWIVFVSLMIIYAQVGYFMVEIGSVYTTNKSQLFLKNILVVAISSIVFFCVGFGFSIDAKGGIIGDQKFVG